MDAQKFSFAPKFPKMGDLQPTVLIVLEENVVRIRKFSNRLNFRGGGNCPPAMTPLVFT